MQSGFGHLCTYGAGYYSYLYSEVFSSAIWHYCFADDPLNREMGQKYRHEVLRHGGAENPMDLLQNLLGEPVSVDHFIRALDIGAASVESSR